MGANQTSETENNNNHLTENDIHYLLSNTYFNRQQIENWYKIFHEKYSNGKMNKEQFITFYMNELRHIWNGRLLAEKIFYLLDINQDNHISFKELLLYYSVKSKGNEREKLQFSFLLYSNHDGYIEYEQFIFLIELLTKINKKYDEYSIRHYASDLFHQYDNNSDRKITCDEFISLILHNREMAQLFTPMFKFNIINQNVTESSNPITSISPLSIEVLNVLQIITNLTREQIIKFYGDFQKKCPTGHLNQQDFIYFYRKLLPKSLLLDDDNDSTKYCQLVFKAFDINLDGQIDFKEFITAFSIRSNGTPRDKLNWLFYAYDRNNDNFISFTELKYIISAIYNLYGLNKEGKNFEYKSYELMALMDINNDDKISKQEFIHACITDGDIRKLLVPMFPSR